MVKKFNSVPKKSGRDFGKGLGLYTAETHI